MRISKLNRKTDANLLLLEDKHCVLINDFSGILSSQISGHHGQNFFCLRCLNHFSKKEILDKHYEYCEKYETVKIKIPGKGERNSILKFENHKYSMEIPICCYADFECFTRKINTCENDPEKSQHESVSKA